MLALAIYAALLFVVSGAALLVGGGLTLFSFSPGTDMGDAYVFVRVGPPMLGGGAFGVWHARRLWRLRKPSEPTARPEPFTSAPRELAWASALCALAFGGTWFLLLSPPWSGTPVILYGASFEAHVVPSRIFLGVVVVLLAIRLLPRLAALSLARRIFTPVQVAALAMAGAASMVLLTYAHSAGFPAMPHTIVLLVLDVTLATVFGSVAIESIAAPSHAVEPEPAVRG